jgi:chaperonin cofactor prefoldin
MPRISLPGRGRGAAATEEAPTKEATPKVAPTKEAPTKEGPTKEAASKDAAEAEQPAKEAAKPSAPKGKAPEPNLQERMEGLQGWMAELERKQARLTYFGAAGVLIAVLAAGAALYFGLTAKSDSAKKSDVDDLSKQVQTLQSAVTKSNKDTQAALNATVTGLQATIAELTKKQAQDASNISTLQAQINAAAKNAAGATTGTTSTPGTTTTTPKKP